MEGLNPGRPSAGREEGALKSWFPVLRVGGAGGWRAAVRGDLGASGAFGRTLHTSCLRSCPPEPSASLRESFTVLPTVVGNRKLTPASRNRLEKGAEGHAEEHTGFRAVLTDVDPRLVPASCGGLRAQSCSASSFSVNSFVHFQLPAAAMPGAVHGAEDMQRGKPSPRSRGLKSSQRQRTKAKSRN